MVKSKLNMFEHVGGGGVGVGFRVLYGDLR